MPDLKISDNMLHATLVQLEQKGILLLGKSGAGKSDLALRLIENKGAVLVADDVVVLQTENGHLYGQTAENLRGMLEVRGIGIVPYPVLEKSKIDLCVFLQPQAAAVERFPQLCKENILGVEIPRIDLYAKECSAVDKVCVGLRLCTAKTAD